MAFSAMLKQKRRKSGLGSEAPPRNPSPKKKRSNVAQFPYMEGSISRQNLEYCTPLSSFTPTLKKFSVFQKMRNKEPVAEPDTPAIHPMDISLIFDQRMKFIEKEPHKLLRNVLQKNAIALRIGYGTVVRIDGTLTF